MSDIKECNVAGEIRPVPLADLVANAAVQYLLANPKSKPRWCLRKTPHDIHACTFLHRTPEKASNYVMVRGEPAPVSIGHLIQNKGLELILGSMEVFGEWCDLASPHDIVLCKKLHLGAVSDDKTVHVEGEESPVNVSHLLLNRGVSYLLTFPEAKGVWCNNKIVHDVVNCPYIHRRIDGHPKVVNVEDEKFPVPVNQLVMNAALSFLLDNPQCSGRWCGRVVNHDVEQCSYLHRRQPYIRVDGETVRINTIKSNRGLKYLLEHPEAQGHWCRSTHDDQHPLETCTFIHPKEGREYQAEAALSRLNGGGAPPPPLDGGVNGSFGNRINGSSKRPSTVDQQQQQRRPSHGTRRGGFENSSAQQGGGRGIGGGGSGNGFGSIDLGINNVNAPQHSSIGTNDTTSHFSSRILGHGNNNNYTTTTAHSPYINYPSPTPYNQPPNLYNNTIHNSNITASNNYFGSARPNNNENTAGRSQMIPAGQNNNQQRPVVGNVIVEGQAVDARTLVNNPGLQYLLGGPTFATGRFCTRVSDPNHRPEICRYIHKV